MEEKEYYVCECGECWAGDGTICPACGREEPINKITKISESEYIDIVWDITTEAGGSRPTW